MSTNATLDRAPAPGSGAPSSEDRPRRFRPRNLLQTLGPFAVFVALFALVAVLQPAFVGGGGLRILAVQSASILLLALGQAMVLHVGSIDLSNAAMAILSAIVLAMTLGPLAGGSLVVSIGLVTVIGAVNGLLVAFAQVPSFALTLGTLGIVQAASLMISGATTVYATGNSQVVAPFFGTAIAGLATAFWVGVLLAVVLWVVLRFTRVGQGMTAVGLNETGALFSGLRTKLLKVVAFTISGFMAGVAGVMIIGQAGAASSFGLGSDLLLPGIAAAMVGGTAITGGVTNPINVIFGALTIALTPIAAAAVGVTSQAQSLVYGLVIIIAVALTMGRDRNRIVK